MTKSTVEEATTIGMVAKEMGHSTFVRARASIGRLALSQAIAKRLRLGARPVRTRMPSAQPRVSERHSESARGGSSPS
jgi:hypothetical protein